MRTQTVMLVMVKAKKRNKDGGSYSDTGRHKVMIMIKVTVMMRLW